jgi:hypothetical protein
LKNIILQHFDGELRELDKLSIENIKQYSEMVGADYQLILGKPFRSHLTEPCQKVHMISEEFDDYDKVCMVDIDMFAPIGMERNIFEEKGVGLYSKMQKFLHRRLSINRPDIASLNQPYWGGAIYHMERSLRQRLRSALGGNESWMEYYNEKYKYEDEGIFHTLAVYSLPRLKKSEMYLDPRWCQDSYLPYPKKAYFIHIREKITPDGPSQDKLKNYHALVKGGVL